MKYISVVSVPVSDPARAKNFYIDKLGFTLIAVATFGDGLRWLQAGSLRGLVIVFHAPPAKQPGN